MPDFRRDEAFTLVEIMIVVLIIGLLISVAIPIFNAAKASTQQKTCFANERAYEGAYQSYVAAGGIALTAGTGVAQTVVDTALVPRYIKAPATCPASGTYTYTVDANRVNITMSCSSHSTFQ